MATYTMFYVSWRQGCFMRNPGRLHVRWIKEVGRICSLQSRGL